MEGMWGQSWLDHFSHVHRDMGQAEMQRKTGYSARRQEAIRSQFLVPGCVSYPDILQDTHISFHLLLIIVHRHRDRMGRMVMLRGISKEENPFLLAEQASMYEWKGKRV